IGQAPAGRQFSVEKWNAFVYLLQQFLIGEPNEVIKVGWHELICIGDLECQLGARRGIRKAVGDVVESSRFAQLAGRFAEYSVIHGCPERKPAGARNFLLCEALTSSYFYFDQLGVGSRNGPTAARRLNLRSARRAQQTEAEKQQRGYVDQRTP